MSELPPFNPDISHLKRQAKELKRAAEGGDLLVLERLATAGANGEKPTLRAAELVIAREHGFAGWHELIKKPESDVSTWTTSTAGSGFT